MSNLLKEASILLTPTAYDNGSMLAVKPSENLYGLEEVTNGDFATDTNWVKGGGWTISGGSANYDDTTNGSLYQNITLNANIYQLNFTISNSTGLGARIWIGNSTGSIDYTSGGYVYYTNGSHSLKINIPSGQASLAFWGNVAGSVFSIDNVSLKEDLSGDFQFSRNSAATRVNAQGLVENVQILSSDLVSNGNFSQEGVQEVSNGSFSQEGSEEITNGNFDTDTKWSKGTGWSISGGSANCDGTQSGNTELKQQGNVLGATIDFVVGKTYKVNFDIVVTSGHITYIEVASGYDNNNITTSGNHTAYITAVSTNDRFTITVNSDFIGSIDNVSVKEVGQDWNLGSNWSIGENNITSNASGLLQQSTSELTSGKTYKTSFEITEYTSGGVKLYSGSGSDTPSYQASLGTHVVFFVANGSTTSLYSNSFIGSITNISVKEVGQDWTLGTGWEIGNNLINFSNPTGTELSQALSTTMGKYKIKFDLNITSGICQTSFVSPGTSTIENFTTSGTKEVIIETTSNYSKFRFVGVGSSDFTITNISVLEITDDTNLPRINYEGFSYQDSLGSEEIVNGDFATDSDWGLAGGSPPTITNNKLNLIGDTYNSIASNVGASIVSGKTYKVSFEITDYTSGGATFRLGGVFGVSKSGLGVHTQYIVSDGAAIRLYSSENGTNLFLTNVSVKEYLGQEVVPNSGCGSWLLEPQSTNLVTYSEDFSNASWGKREIAVSNNQTTAPNGTLTADKLFINGGNSELFYLKNSGLVVGADMVFSFYVKKGSISTPKYAIYDNTNLSYIVPRTSYNTTDEWVRIEIPFTVPTGCTSIEVAITYQAGAVAEGTNIFIWGAQLEQQSFATSYIPTQGATSTRLRDIASNSGNASLINSEEGTFYAEISALADNNAADLRWMSLNDNSTNNLVALYYYKTTNTIGAQLRVGNSQNFRNDDIPIPSKTDFIKIAFKWKQDDVSIYINGTKEASSNSVNVFNSAVLNNISFNGGNINDPFYGKNKALAVYKTALTDSSLRCLTYPPAVATTFDLNFNTIAEQFTFTRGSEATFVNAQGLIQSTNEIGSELVTNGDFTTDSDWSLTQATISNGKVTISTQDGSYSSARQFNSLVIGKTYLFTIDVDSVSVGSIAVGNSSLNINSSGIYSGYYVSNSTTAEIKRNTFGSATNAVINSISIKEHITATNTPRLDYSTGSEAFLLEPQTTQLVAYSEDFSQYNLNGDTAIESGYLAPDGTNNAYKVSGTNGYLNLSSISNLGINSTKSIYARTVSGSGTVSLISYYGNTNNLFTVTEQWQRFEVNTSISTGSTSFYGADFRGSGTLSEIIIFGANATNDQNYATSYIPTSGATATRNQELCNNATPVINSEEGTLYAEISALANHNLQRWLGVSDGTTNNSLNIGFLNSNTDYRIACEIRSGNSNQAYMTYNFGAVEPTFAKIAVKYKENDFSLWVNGVEVATDTSGATPIGLSKLNFDRGDGVADFYGNTKGLKYYPKALADVQLEDLTTI